MSSTTLFRPVPARRLASARHLRSSGFTLIELLVVISIIALLIGILLPALGAARKESRAIACAAQQKSIAVAAEAYVVDAKGYYPASYVYAKSAKGLDWNWSDQFLGATKPHGYIHWSYALMANGSVNGDAFTCPEIKEGGHPPTSPSNDDIADGQSRDPNVGGGAVDRQARRMAFTANGALMPRNKFTGGSGRLSRFARPDEVLKPTETILASEFTKNWKNNVDGIPVKSHRPIQGFFSSNGYGDGVYSNGGIYADLILQASEVIDGDTHDAAVQSGSSLWNGAEVNNVGRHHPGSYTYNGKDYGGQANFLYADGHSERKNVMETVVDREWGERFYTLRPEPTIRH